MLSNDVRFSLLTFAQPASYRRILRQECRAKAVSVTVVHTHARQLRNHSGGISATAKTSAGRSRLSSFAEQMAKARHRPALALMDQRRLGALLWLNVCLFRGGRMTLVSSIRHGARRYGPCRHCSGHSSMSETAIRNAASRTRLCRCINVIQRERHGHVLS